MTRANVPHVISDDSALGGQLISGSLKFDGAKGQYLSRTPSSAGNRKTFTWSGWVKRAEINSTQGRLFGGGNTSNYFSIYFPSDNLIRVIWYEGGQVFTNTTAKFIDPSAWYHIVIAVDTTQSTDGDRIKIYVNGVLQEKNNSNAPSQNSDTSVNNTVEHNIGKYLTGNASYFDGSSIIWQSMLIDAAVVWLYANLVLGLFNMIPWGPLDGAKVKDWNEQVYYLVFLIFLIPVLGMFFGFWSPASLLESIVTKLF